MVSVWYPARVADHGSLAAWMRSRAPAPYRTGTAHPAHDHQIIAGLDLDGTAITLIRQLAAAASSRRRSPAPSTRSTRTARPPSNGLPRRVVRLVAAQP
jgi:hypothetical protein